MREQEVRRGQAGQAPVGTRGDHAGFQRDGGELPEVPPRAGPRLSSRLTERPTLACVSLGKGSVVYDSSFDLFKEIGHLCRLCKAIAGNSELVKPGGAQCLPSGVCGSQFLRGRRDGGGHRGPRVDSPEDTHAWRMGIYRHTSARVSTPGQGARERSRVFKRVGSCVSVHWPRGTRVRTCAVCVGTPAGVAFPKLGAGAVLQVTGVMSCRGSP